MSDEESVEATGIWKDASAVDASVKKNGYTLYYQSQYPSDTSKAPLTGHHSNINVFLFRPNLHFPKLTIYNDSNFLGGAKIVVDRRRVFVVTATFENHWFHVKADKIDGWIHISPPMTQHQSVTEVNYILRHQLWRGNNYFFLGGRCMTSYDIPLFRYE